MRIFFLIILIGSFLSLNLKANADVDIFSTTLENENTISENIELSTSENEKEDSENEKEDSEIEKSKKVYKDDKLNLKKKSKPIGISLSFKPSYFWPQDKVYRGIYGDGFLPLLEICYDISKYTKFFTKIFTEIGCFYKGAHVTSANLRASTNIIQVPLTVGLNFFIEATSFLDFYFKMGPNWVYTKTYVDIDALKKTVVRHAFGITFGTGGRFIITKNFFLELFFNYLYDKRKIHDTVSKERFHRYLGGIQTGGGIGVSF